MSGPPPDGHPRQCQAKSMHTRERCRRWALVGRKYCQFHGGRNPRTRTNDLPRYYKLVGETLGKKLKTFLDEPHDEAVNLYEELAISRATCLDALKLFEASMGIADPNTRATANDVMRSALNHVKDMVVAAAKIEKDADDKVSIKVIQMFVDQIVRAIYRVCDDKDMAKKIEKEIRNNVRMPKEINENSGAEFNLGDELKHMDLMTEPGDEMHDNSTGKGQG